MWRVAWDIFPHWVNLSKKGVTSVDKCQRCGMLENNSHVLKDCYWARDVWQQIMEASAIPHYSSFREWVGALMEQKYQIEVEIFSVLEMSFVLKKFV